MGDHGVPSGRGNAWDMSSRASAVRNIPFSWTQLGPVSRSRVVSFARLQHMSES